jgi:DNA-binding transcriptional regulator PaaX
MTKATLPERWWRGKWVVWVTYTRADEKISEREVRRCLTRRGAKRYARAMEVDPRILLKTMETMESGPPIWADFDVREAA